jgi:hypothetical protein
MDKEVSIILSNEERNYRKLAQTHYNLTDEQMEEMDVHHNPPRHQGGRDIPEHLYVYHRTLHAAVHGDNFTEWARKGGKAGGNSSLEKQVGWHDPKIKSAAGKKGGATNAKNKTGVCGIAIDERRENGRKGGITAFEESVGIFAPENLGKGGRNVSKDDCVARGKKAAETNRQNRTAFFDPAIQKQGTIAAHSKKDDEGKSIHAKKVGKIAFSQKWMDPDHPELGIHNAGNLVRVQRAEGLPHGKENRRRVG